MKYPLCLHKDAVRPQYLIMEEGKNYIFPTINDVSFYNACISNITASDI